MTSKQFCKLYAEVLPMLQELTDDITMLQLLVKNFYDGSPEAWDYIFKSKFKTIQKRCKEISDNLAPYADNDTL